MLVLFNEGHVGVMFGLLYLCVGDIHPREKAVQEERKRVLVHVDLLSLGDLTAGLLVVLNVIEVDSLDSIAEVIFVYVGVS